VSTATRTARLVPDEHPARFQPMAGANCLVLIAFSPVKPGFILKIAGIGITVARDWGWDMNDNDFAIAVGEAAQDAVWSTPHQLPQRLADDDPRREKYLRDLRDYQLSVGRQVLAAIENLRASQQDGITTVPFVPRMNAAS
jgi:hypothetical protein